MSITATSSRPAKAKPTLSGDCPSPFTGPRCKFGAVGVEEPNKALVSYVKLPKDLDKTTFVTLTVKVRGKDIGTVKDSAKVTYVVKEKKPPLKPDSGEGPSDGKSGKSGTGSGGSSGSNGGSSGNGSSSGGNNTPYVPPSPNSTFNPSTQSPQVALPQIAQPSPSVAAATAPAPNSRLRGNERPVAQDLTFERMASTQVAWLAALMVAFSLLLTQLRLGRRRTGPAAAPIRPKGDHRRPRRGVFGK
ncbi:hypothetical protein ACGFNU_31170 [Spirillospora sp. NPDC048911]|uniref:hypothetical protein n=1 Tax=Spirillospora sp. NPDC048911 TaxID=3364527 RepID=UPI00370F941E